MAKKNKQNMADLPLVAIDLGSDSVRAMAAVSLGPDTLHILGAEKSTRYAYTEKGNVTDTHFAAYMIKEALQLLANRIHVEEIPSAFVVLGGYGMKIQALQDKRDLIRAHAITPELLERIKREFIRAMETSHPTVCVLDLVPTYYVLDGEEQDECPTPDQVATILEVHYIAFFGHKDMKQKVNDSFILASIFQEGSFVRSDALLSAFGTGQTEIYQQGCAVLDMGAQTTTLSIYKGNQYLASKVVPIGGWHITRAIEHLGIGLQYAEALKCQLGWACRDLAPTGKKVRIPSVQEKDKTLHLDLQDLADVIDQKLNDILTPILEVLQPYEQRISTLFITGGGSMLQGLEEYIQRRTRVDVLPGSHAILLDASSDDEYCKPQYASLVGALLLGADYRKAHKQEVPDKKTMFFDSIRERFETGTLALFTENTPKK